MGGEGYDSFLVFQSDALVILSTKSEPGGLDIVGGFQPGSDHLGVTSTDQFAGLIASAEPYAGRSLYMWYDGLHVCITGHVPIEVTPDWFVLV